MTDTKALVETVRNALDAEGLPTTGGYLDLAHTALSELEARLEADTEEWEAIERDHGLPFLLDHLGLDYLGNQVIELRRRAEAAECEVERLKNLYGEGFSNARRVVELEEALREIERASVLRDIPDDVRVGMMLTVAHAALDARS